nr:hypothetical protein BaRGS_034568 [Batillaria attramentaria]
MDSTRMQRVEETSEGSDCILLLSSAGRGTAAWVTEGWTAGRREATSEGTLDHCLDHHQTEGRTAGGMGTTKMKKRPDGTWDCSWVTTGLRVGPLDEREATSEDLMENST